jgi:hypothetical protein
MPHEQDAVRSVQVLINLVVDASNLPTGKLQRVISRERPRQRNTDNDRTLVRLYRPVAHSAAA